MRRRCVHLGQRGGGEAAIELVGIPSIARKKMKDERYKAFCPMAELTSVNQSTWLPAAAEPELI